VRSAAPGFIAVALKMTAQVPDVVSDEQFVPLTTVPATFVIATVPPANVVPLVVTSNGAA